MKHVVIDARLIETSTGRYIQRLVENLNDIGSEQYCYTVLVPSEHVIKWQHRLTTMDVQAADQKWYTFTEQWSLYWQLRHLKPDLVHFTMPQQPLMWTGSSIATVHDTTLIHYSTNRTTHPVIFAVRRFIFKILLRIVVSRSKRVLTPTEFVKNDLIEFSSDRNTSKFVVTLEAGEPAQGDPEPVEALVNTPYLFFVGNAFPYKNLRLIIEAFKKVKQSQPEFQLVFAGKKDYFYEQLAVHAKDIGAEDVHILGFVSDGEKRWLFQNAAAYVVASLSEGFHIPGLEAMYEGCPVISSNATCLPEVLGEAALYFDPTSAEDLAEKVELLLGDAKLRDSLIIKGNTRVKQFSWRKMSQQTKDVYDQLLHDR